MSDLVYFGLLLLVFPFLEEIVFRWGMLDWADSRVKKTAGLPNNALVSLVFALAHTAAWGHIQALAVFVPSIVLGYLWQRYRSLSVCILIHSIFNLIGYLSKKFFAVFLG